MFLVNYSSSSESEDEKSKEVDNSTIINELPKTQTNRILLPQASSLLGKHKLKSNDDDVTDDPSKHDGRIRSFKHERGNWATYVCIPVETNILEDIQDICLSHLEENFNFKTSSEMHISLTKTIVLQYHFIESFVETLKTALQSVESFTASLNNIKVYTNAERTRTFLALKVDDLYYEKMLNILHKVDKVMKDFKLATFYEDPSFHISILWCTGDNVSLVEALVPTIMESLMERLPLHLKFDKIYCKSGFKEYNFKLK
ncbi:U6 snRNA phosphodiesterase 1 [Calliphora vicina]|uniref:U6 snRNA phosphodiesterase 1 n=1 Tax=Calliphora vicina TaxID=7373 RepID=UPI00325ADAFA